jgi:carboxyl-terminal processing protease
MRRKVFPAVSVHLVAVLAVLFIGIPALGQTVPGSSDVEFRADVESRADVAVQADELLRQGRQMEVESRWGEALTHYENAVRAFPQEDSFRRRFDFARLHYDLGRRCSDQTFADLVTRLSLEEALAIYDEVLLKIQANYVDTPSWKKIVERGTNGIEVALSEPAFLQQNLPDSDTSGLDEFRHELRRELGGRVIQTRSAARAAVLQAAKLSEDRLGISPTAIVLEYTCGAANALDAYSAYLTPSQLTDVYSQIEGNFVGLGIELKAADGNLVIVRVIPKSPAERAGMIDNDRILAVDGQSTQDLSTDQAASLLQGESGSIVNLTLLTLGSDARSVSVRRERVEVPSINDAQILDATRGIAYFKLTCFQKTTCRDMDATLWRLHKAGMRGLIIDLQGNPGGLLMTAVEVADKFIERGVIVSTRGRNIQEDQTYSAHQIGTWRVPLVVLIDKDSASAAEIFAGAIREHHRGTVIGTRSYGKGSVQGIFPLARGDIGVRLTTARFYSPGGHPYSHVGVEPDLVVSSRIVVRHTARPIDGAIDAPTYDSGSDPLLSAALQAADKLMKQR